MFIAHLFSVRRPAAPLTALGLHVGVRSVSAVWLTGDGMQPGACVAKWSMPGSGLVGDGAWRDALVREIAARGLQASALAVVLETDAFVRDTVSVSDEGTARERAEDLRLELLARHPALGAEPRWVVDDDGVIWALPQARWQDAQALASQLDATLALIGHADAARALAQAQADADGHTPDESAALGAALGVWHGLQPQWWPEGVQRRRRRWQDTARHALRASALGVGVAVLGLGAMHAAHAWRMASVAGEPTVAELEHDLAALQREWAPAQARAQRALQRQQHIAAIERQHQHTAQVLQTTAHVPGLWLASVSQHGADWQWQGEAETPAVAQQLVRALTPVGRWRQAPQLRDERWQTGRDAAATVWAFRIQAQAEAP